jgi:hypothetical protein
MTPFTVTKEDQMCFGHRAPIPVGATAYEDDEGWVWCADPFEDARDLGCAAVMLLRFADKVMTMIDEDIAAGKVPAWVGSFSALHDYVDANEYLIQALDGAWESGDLVMGNAVSDEVDQRLADRTAGA